MSERPALSVVVGLISGKKADLERCLAALFSQTAPVALEVLVPYDDFCAEVATLAGRFPAARFLRAEGLDTAEARRGASREHHDTLRTIGLRAARGEVVALTEDHALVAPEWCAEMVAALERHTSAAAVGGAVECDNPSLLGWAVWFCDFGRYQNPLPEGRAPFVSDSNVAYRRSALERVAADWAGDYHETAVHWAMEREGFELVTTPRAVVWQARGRLSLAAALRERYVWARSFAGTRVRGARLSKRLVYAVLTPLLPFVLTARLARTAFQRGRHRGRFLLALPLVSLLQTAWALGELAGYLRGRP